MCYSSFGHVPPPPRNFVVVSSVCFCVILLIYKTQTLMINGVYSLPFFIVVYIFIFRKLEGFKVLCFVCFLKK